eukprot:SAG11_NODE_925_length_6524_cov_3.379300_5_plen_267_part_00
MLSQIDTGKRPLSGFSPISSCVDAAPPSRNGPFLVFYTDYRYENRAPDEETLLSLAIATGDAALVRSAIDARDRACRWNMLENMDLSAGVKASQVETHARMPGRTPGRTPGRLSHARTHARTFIAMDVALLCVYFPDMALEVLEHPSMMTAESDGASAQIDLLEAAGSDALLKAALYSREVDKLLATPILSTVLHQRMRVLWPFYWLEFALLLCLSAFFTAWAFGTRSCTIPSLVLAAFFGIIEALQLLDSFRPLFGVASLRQVDI